MDFLTFLSNYEREDVSSIKHIVESNKTKECNIISEAFKGDYVSKKEALLMVENYFVDEVTAPKSVDVDYVKHNMDDIKDKIENLSEGDIRIIIHNHEDSKDKSGGVAYEEESAKPKIKRGRPAKRHDFTKAPKNTGIVYGDGPGIVSDAKDVAPLDGEEELSEEETAYLGQLESMQLSEEELKSASDMAEFGTIDEEDDSKVSKAASVITKINALK